ncbi:MAG: hypothetical protein QM758_21520 [Armatimonas sp.]
MRFFAMLCLTLLSSVPVGVASAQISVTGGDMNLFSAKAAVEPGSFGTPEFFITLVKSKSKQMTVGGRYTAGQSRRSISGILSGTHVLRARLNDGPETAIDGKYNPGNDTIVITRIGNKTVNEVLERFDTLTDKPEKERVIKPGTYTGQTEEPDSSWTVSITPSKSKAFNLVGSATIEGKRREVKGTLYPTGKIVGTHNGRYDSDDQSLLIDFPFGPRKLTVVMRQGQMPTKISLFGLVDKKVGNVPGAAEATDHHIEGSVSEDSFSVGIRMKPPYMGEAKISFGFSTNMGSTLKPRQLVELTVWGESSKGGSYQPNLSGTGQWIVEGDGADIVESSKVFVGTASNGQHYASGRGKVLFRVRDQGTIKITASYSGQTWGGAGNWNWNPCTYTYKFREPAKAKVGPDK